MRRIIKICPHCQKPFFPKKKHETVQIFCSPLHRTLAWKKTPKGAENARAWQKKKWRKLHPFTQITKKCVYCQNSFVTDTKHKYQKYCSWRCRNKQSQTPERRTKWRRNWRQNHLEEIKKKDGLYKAKTRFGGSSKTLNKQVVLKRDKELCQICSNPYQVIHHIKYSGLSKDLVCLCRACHATIHQRFDKEPFWEGNYNSED